MFLFPIFLVYSKSLDKKDECNYNDYKRCNYNDYNKQDRGENI